MTKQYVAVVMSRKNYLDAPMVYGPFDKLDDVLAFIENTEWDSDDNPEWETLFSPESVNR